MKLIIRMGVMLIALAAGLTESAVFAQQPIARPRSGSVYLAASPNAASRVRSRTTAQQRLTAEQDAAPLAEETPAPIEPIEASEARSDAPGVTGEFWDGVGEETGFDGGCCDVPCGLFCRPGLWYASADYLLIRPQFSQGVALEQRVVTTTTNPSTQQPTSTATDTSRNYCFNYNSAFRVSVGYRLIDCGGDIQFTYWRMTGTDSVAAGPAEVTNGSNIIIGQLGCNPQDGQFYNAYTGVTANVFDLDFAKCLAFGGPQGDCECTVCPRWDLRWLAGFPRGRHQPLQQCLRDRPQRLSRFQRQHQRPIRRGGSADRCAKPALLRSLRTVECVRQGHPGGVDRRLQHEPHQELV